MARILTILDMTSWWDIEKYLVEHLPKHTCCIAEGKLTLGLSAYDLTVTTNQIQKTALTLKKITKNDGRPCRIVPNSELALSSAQVLHNRLFTSHNWELLLIRHGDKTILAQTAAVQDIEAYAARDQARPKRDARVGMLPPKLAQIIINLATGQAEDTESTEDPSTKSNLQTTILDPFCGTGVVLQEALLMGYRATGTDLEPRMIEYSQTNLDWLSSRYNLQPTTYNLLQGDATALTWSKFDTIACETYLGRPFSSEPSPTMLQEVIQDVDTIHRKFLKNVARQTKPGFRLCIAVPAWKTKSGFKHLKTLDSLDELGYTRMSFAHASNRDLIYHRENQFVGRELVVLIRK